MTPDQAYFTSSRHSAWRPNPGRDSLNRRGESVQTTGASSEVPANSKLRPIISINTLCFGAVVASRSWATGVGNYRGIIICRNSCDGAPKPLPYYCVPTTIARVIPEGIP